MAQFETGIRNTLLADVGVAEVIGERIRPLGMNHADEFPYITYQVTDRKSDPSIGGEICEYRKAEFELGIYAADYDMVMDLSELCRDRLDQFGETVSGVEFAPCEYENETDIEQVVPDGEEMPYYLRVQTFKALYKITT